MSLAEGERAKEEGMDLAAQNRAEALALAKRAAVYLGKQNEKVSIMDVYAFSGLTSDELGNAAGSVFRGKHWTCVGWETNTNTSAHAREVRVWSLNENYEGD